MLQSRIPEIASYASLATQRAVERAGQEVEFHALQHASSRRRTGAEMQAIRWVPNRKQPHQGRVVSSFVTRFHEYGTIFISARPALGPAAEEVAEHFLHDMSNVYR